MQEDRRSEDRLFGQLLASRSSRAGKSTAVATFASVAFHALIITCAVWATLAFGREVIAEPEEQITLLELFEEMPEPPSPPVREPEPPPQEAEPPAPEPVVQPEPEEPAGYQTLAEPEDIPDEIPESSGLVFDESDFTGEGIEGGRGGGALDAEAKLDNGDDDQPYLSHYTVAPVLLNMEEVAEAMYDAYPRMLKAAGIGGVVLVWIRIDEEGQVVRSLVNRSSGRGPLDDAALEVTRLMRFKPGQNDDQPVPVWVVMPIEFRVE
ncbi:MAG: TonB family protein [Gemmatimonadota bacterium]|nr:MAG: TonB family protein [Gemmatimonadota bacterium]